MTCLDPSSFKCNLNDHTILAAKILVALGPYQMDWNLSSLASAVYPAYDRQLYMYVYFLFQQRLSDNYEIKLLTGTFELDR